MNKAEIDELRTETIEQLHKLQNVEDMEAARKHAVDLLTDFLEILGENEMVEAYENLLLD